MYHTVHYSSLMCHFVFHGMLHTCGAPLCNPLSLLGVCTAHAHVLCHTLDSPVSDIGLYAAHHSCLRAEGEVCVTMTGYKGTMQGCANKTAYTLGAAQIQLYV